MSSFRKHLLLAFIVMLAVGLVFGQRKTRNRREIVEPLVSTIGQEIFIEQVTITQALNSQTGEFEYILIEAVVETGTVVGGEQENPTEEGTVTVTTYRFERNPGDLAGVNERVELLVEALDPPDQNRIEKIFDLVEDDWKTKNGKTTRIMP